MPMVTLANYPNVSQLSAKTNPSFDCVPASIVDGLEYLTGKHYDIDALVTAAYGPGHTGGTAAAAYVPFCASIGVHLYPIDGPPQTLVADLHALIQEGKPCLLTEPDVYAPLHPDWSHVLSVYSELPGTLTARDPYSTRDVTHSDATWAQLLEFREIWAMEVEIMPLDIKMPEVAKLFKELSPTAWQSLATGCVIHDGFLHDYISNGVVSLDYLGDVVENEKPQGNGRSMQRYAKGVRYDDNNTFSSLPIYGKKGEHPLGEDPLVLMLEDELLTVGATNAKLQAQIAALQSQPAAPALNAAQVAALEQVAAAFGWKKLV